MAQQVTTDGSVALSAPPGTCLLCGTVDVAVTDDALTGGAHWRCVRCGQMWDATRLAAAAAYSSRHGGKSFDSRA